MSKFPFIKQSGQMDCGVVCLAMMAKYYGKTCSIQKLRDMCNATNAGVRMLGINDAAEKLGFKTMGVCISFDKLLKDIPLPCIVHWKQRHFVVVYSLPNFFKREDITSLLEKESGKIGVADPSLGLVTYTVEEFCNNWFSPQEEKGIALLLEPTSAFYNQKDEQ
ncbi:MAG TPA: cysteine peptidase family C39 domain-containing protein [Bacteroidales bacterium]|nr:cysteine peptidase family C39 domain-containing protein [Bacteroidales bacterium]HOR82633.1 cysteine peptidase family C39 domain-containing protein [Bacteroidales bacterium]HPJ91824.1 cysteine peptidase family C39 domain-containing protein [Bacteroidales bacterium]